MNRSNSSFGGEAETDGFIEIKDKHAYQRIFIDDILFIESSHIYVNIYTAKGKLLLRSSLAAVIAAINRNSFIKVHRGYAINLAAVKDISQHQANLGSYVVPISKGLSKSVMKHFMRIRQAA